MIRKSLLLLAALFAVSTFAQQPKTIVLKAARLFDSHVHLTSEIGDNFYVDYFQNLMRHPAEQAILATTYARKTIDAGFTTVRNLGAGDYVDVGLRNAINNGWTVG